MVRDFKLLLSKKNFRYIWISQLTSQITINVMNFVFLIKLFEATGSSIATSFLWIAYALPAVFVGPFAAASVDFFDRRKVLVITNLLQSLIILSFALFHGSSYFIIYGVVVFYSLLNQFYIPAEAATIPSILNKSDLVTGNSLSFFTQQSALVLGFGISGAIYGLLGFSNTLFICALFLFIAFVSVFYLPEMKTSNIHGVNYETKMLNFVRSIFSGYSYLKNNKKVLIPIALMIILQIALTIIVINVPIISSSLLKIDVKASGLLVVVPSAVGSIVGANIVSKLIKIKWRKKKIIDFSLVLLALTLFLFSVVVVYLDGLFKFLYALGLFVVLGIAFVGVMIPVQTYFQEVTPDNLRGRVFGNYGFLLTIMTIFPVVFSATITELLGIRVLLIVLSVLVFCLFVLSNKKGSIACNN